MKLLAPFSIAVIIAATLGADAEPFRWPAEPSPITSLNAPIDFGLPATVRVAIDEGRVGLTAEHLPLSVGGLQIVPRLAASHMRVGQDELTVSAGATARLDRISVGLTGTRSTVLGSGLGPSDSYRLRAAFQLDKGLQFETTASQVRADGFVSEPATTFKLLYQTKF